MKYFGMEEYKSKAAQAIENQRLGIENSRVADFDRLLLTEFKNTNDSLALQMKSVLENPSDTLLLMEARKWYGLRY
jgi:hypothetical protein